MDRGDSEEYRSAAGYELVGVDKDHLKSYFQFFYAEDVSSHGCLNCFIESYEKGSWDPVFLEDTWAIVPNCESSRNFNFPSHCWKCKSYLPSKEDEIFWFVKK